MLLSVRNAKKCLRPVHMITAHTETSKMENFVLFIYFLESRTKGTIITAIKRRIDFYCTQKLCPRILAKVDEFGSAVMKMKIIYRSCYSDIDLQKSDQKKF